MAPTLSAKLSVSRALWAGMLFVWLFSGRASADETGAEDRLVTLRDGSHFRATLAPLSMEWAESGPTKTELTRTRMSLLDVSRIEFAPQPDGEKLKKVLQAMTELDAEAFEGRELASLWLLRNTGGFRPLLDQGLALAGASPERRWRLGSILRQLPGDILPLNQRPFDRVYPHHGEPRNGDLGSWSAAATFRGGIFPLTRESVASISRPDDGLGAPALKKVRRLASADDPAFGTEARTLSFEADSEGRELVVGDDIATRFVRDGVTFSTSEAESFVSVNLYEVSGPSRGHSVATHNPLYEGTVTIRFCSPGNPGVPAGVGSVGLWLAVVKENGTTLQALGASGEIISEILALRGPSQFLGLTSDIPIHAVRIIPHPDIDPNYTIDDLVFTRTRPVDGLGVAEYPTLSFREGDRVVCRDFTIEDGEIVFRPASFENVRVRSPLSDVQSLYAPLSPKTPTFEAGSFWVELTDGSRLLANSADGPVLSRIAGTDLESLPLAALWGPKRVPSPPPADTSWEPGSGPCLVHGSGAQVLPPARLGPRWIEPEGEAFPGNLPFTYDDSPTIWFARPETAPVGAGQLRFPNGERLVLGGSAGFRLKAITTSGITIERGGKEWTFPLSETSAIQFPGP